MSSHVPSPQDAVNLVSSHSRRPMRRRRPSDLPDDNLGTPDQGQPKHVRLASTLSSISLFEIICRGGFANVHQTICSFLLYRDNVILRRVSPAMRLTVDNVVPMYRVMCQTKALQLQNAYGAQVVRMPDRLLLVDTITRRTARLSPTRKGIVYALEEESQDKRETQERDDGMCWYSDDSSVEDPELDDEEASDQELTDPRVQSAIDHTRHLAARAYTTSIATKADAGLVDTTFAYMSRMVYNPCTDCLYMIAGSTSNPMTHECVPSTDGKIWRSSDHGRTWSLVLESCWLRRTNHRVVCYDDGTFLMTGGEGTHYAFRSHTQGITWSQINPPWRTARSHHAMVLANSLVAQGEQVVYVSGGKRMGSMALQNPQQRRILCKSVWVSHDKGTVWKRQGTLPERRVKSRLYNRELFPLSAGVCNHIMFNCQHWVYLVGGDRAYTIKDVPVLFHFHDLWVSKDGCVTWDKVFEFQDLDTEEHFILGANAIGTSVANHVVEVIISDSIGRIQIVKLCFGKRA